jgi:antitoxin MazE
MQASIIQIGNSKGLRLNKTILEKYGFRDKVELILQDDQLVIRPCATPRKGWNEAFALMHENGDDVLLIDSVFEDEDFDN